MLAGYLVFQLRRALGRRSDNQEPKSKPSTEQRAELSEADNVVAIKPNKIKTKTKNKKKHLAALLNYAKKIHRSVTRTLLRARKKRFS